MPVRNERAFKKQKYYIVIKICLVFLLFFGILFVFYKSGNYIVQAVTKKFINFDIATQGTVQDHIFTTGVIIQEENVYYAPTNGKLENTVKDFTRVRANTKLGYFIKNGSRTPLDASVTGIFTKNTDGLECFFSSVDIRSVSQKIFDHNVNMEDNFANIYYKNDPVFKIVNNLKPHKILIKIPESKIDTLDKGSRIRVIHDDIDYGIAVVEEIHKGSNAFMLLKMSGFFENLVNKRYFDVELVYNQYTGYIIPNNALIEKNGEIGLYCIRGERTRFVPVEIIQKNDNVLVVDGLRTNDMYITNPNVYLRIKK
ncbi:hypothetical protein SYNTR_1102 [Candidatus Syntrophocurvum alkaliphilum]|uniref:RND related beta-barrel domain-containing protein n=1 Tax=Candidatus Syntrophocurvum alkaliphilum TaxID=2293317 RepID=A0A6I6DAC6_9FIRM|nr:HlyD family efflux transporter periplasmic adaptor subunit [Candidatus Syntrophocurvum alkaliphilum]QGT99695.1 hypothetical protein SYNTR_1102 [Candidatus Syntrophocurvum alkaliphilum]